MPGTRSKTTETRTLFSQLPSYPSSPAPSNSSRASDTSFEHVPPLPPSPPPLGSPPLLGSPFQLPSPNSAPNMSTSQATQGGTPDNSQASPGNTTNASYNLTPDQLSALVATAVQTSVSQVVQSLHASRQRIPSEVESRKAKSLIASSSSLPKLKDGSYSQWSFALSDTIRAAGLLGHVDGSGQQPDGTDPRALEKWLQEDAAVRSTIVSALDHDMSYRYLEGTTTAREAWVALERHYKTSDTASLMAIDKELANLRMPEGGDVVEHIATLRKLKRRLDGSDFAVNEVRCKAILFRSLPPNYEPWITRHEESDQTTFDRLCSLLETQYRSQKARAGETGGTISAFPALARSTHPISPQSVAALVASALPPDLTSRYSLTGARNPALGARAHDTCRDCLFTGHRSGAPQCPYNMLYRWRIELFGPPMRRNGQKGQRTSGASTSSGATMPAGTNVATTTAVAGTSTASIEVVSANVATSGSTDASSSFPSYAAYSAVIDTNVPSEVLAYAATAVGSFLVDTGCQRHMTCVRSIFVQIEEFYPPILIRGIGDTGIEASHRGTIAIPVEIDGALSWFYLDDVLYAPELHRNLISTGALLESGLHVTLSLNGATIYDNSSCSKALAIADFKERLWILRTDHSVAAVQAAPSANIATTGVGWHKRMGHIGAGALRKLSGEGLIGKLTESDLAAIERCRVCVLGKGARLPFHGSGSTAASAPIELLHSDLCGPFDASVGGARYLASFVDDYTRTAWVFLLKTKDELAAKFMRLRAHLELFTGLKVKTLRSDGGGEYHSSLLDGYIADAGILHQTSCPNSSQQNGVAERFQRTLLDRVRCMLEEASMSWGWWGEAVLTAVHLYNRTPHSALPNHACPLSFWSNKPVSIAHLRVFGSTCFAIDTAKDRKKSAHRAIECRLLGYDSPSKAYRLQVKGSTKVMRSRDVIFHEDASLDTAEDAAPPIPVDLDCPPGYAVGGPLGSVGEGSTTVGEEPTSVGAEDSLTADPVSGVPIVERPKRNRRATWKVREAAQSNVATAPKTFKAAMKGPEARQWKEAVDGEYASWEEKGVYEVVLRPQDEEIIPTILLLNRKTDETGAEVRKKARCVARGDMQSQSSEDGPTLASPVASMVTLRAMAALAAQTNCEFQQMDVKTAFLHAPLSRPVYLSIPSGFPDSKLLPGIPRAGQALRLMRAVYGLREAPASWYNHCTGILISNGFTRSDNDHCLFWTVFPGSSERCYVLVYVDDFTLLTGNAEQMAWLKRSLSSLFDLKDLGAANQVLGLEVVRDREAGTLMITQRKFARQLLEEYDMLDCRPLDTPMFANAGSSLPSHLVPLTASEVHYMRDKDYRHLLGCLNWLVLGSRPDLAYALARLGQAQSNPHPEHWQALIHILRYLSGTIDMGLVYSRSAKDPSPHLYTDSAFADCPLTRKSHSGYVVLLAGAAISWSSRKQAIVTTSSTEAEYIAMGHAAKQAMWIRRLMGDLGVALDGALRIYADNQSSLLLAESDKLSSRTKHLDVQYHFVREQIKEGVCRFLWVPTKLNVADVLTKPLGPALFEGMPPMLGVPWARREYTSLSDGLVDGTRSDPLHAPSGAYIGARSLCRPQLAFTAR